MLGNLASGRQSDFLFVIPAIEILPPSAGRQCVELIEVGAPGAGGRLRVSGVACDH